MAENKYLKAIDCFEEYYRCNPDQAAVTTLYSLYIKIGDYNKAEALFNEHSVRYLVIKDVLNNQEYTDLQLIKDFCYTDKHNIVIINLKLAISLNDKEHIYLIAQY